MNIVNETSVLVNPLNIKTDTYYKGALFISFLIGIAFRIYHLFIIGFEIPFNLGGLFYQMTIEIIRNGFFLPSLIPYYYPGGLPFAYPPLPFYIQAALIKLFSPDMFVTVNALPPFISVLSLFAFFFLAQKAIKNKVGIVAAVFSFSIIPIAFTEQIEAMGLSESIGTLSLILYTFTLLWARDKEQNSFWIIPGIALGLCVMSGPGSIYASILISVLFLGISIADFLINKNSQFLIACFIVGSAGIFVSSPYWGTVISNHGLGIFINPFTAQNSRVFRDFLQNAFYLRLIYCSPYWNVLFLFGLLATLIKRQYSLILYSIVLLPIPRENWIMSIPASLLIGIGIVYLLDLLRSIPKINNNLLKVAVIWTMILFFGFDSGSNLLFLINDDTYDISAVQIDDLEKINESNLIPADQYVAVIGNWGLIEWSPALLKRTVINNPFGLEWLPDRNEKNILLSENLLQYTSPAMIMESIQEDFPDINRIYIVAEQEYLVQLKDSGSKNRVVYKLLKGYDSLGLGLICVQNR